jgi:hypothetical protein
MKKYTRTNPNEKISDYFSIIPKNNAESRKNEISDMGDIPMRLGNLLIMHKYFI